MLFLYNFIIHIAYFFLKIIALFNPKMKLFIAGRKKTFEKLSDIEKNDKVFWIHAASLGEFEQGIPIIEKLKQTYTNHKVVVSFFSPSGYEIRKHYSLADVVCYLPFDTRKNVKKFIKQIHPDIAIIIKYEFWPNLLHELKSTNTKTILVSGIFRDNQLFFKPYGKWMRSFLPAFNHFFVQNQKSKELLQTINFKNVTVSGDTRFDRVAKILHQNNQLNFIEDFKDNTYTVVAGSTWIEDENLIVNYINSISAVDEKFIIAPHTMDQNKIKELRKSIQRKAILFSEKDNVNLKDFDVLIIDTIGLLTKIYAYADVAYVGGGLATGLHNTLEPATFGIPVVFGGNMYQKFNEAKDLLKVGGGKTVLTKEDFLNVFLELKNNIEYRNQMGTAAGNYVQNNTGATQLVMDYITKHNN